ncbi:HIT family protein [Clostridium tyrobutyricum]|uniref:HIT family protein n=1 Tax=Clostridium tyrobutyricum TaxID=1519 RepID=UPI00057C89A1|nr:HIT family protein [Clostridium tyrobutyricum]
MIKYNCFYCNKDWALHDLMIEISELNVSTLYLNKDQTHRGRCIVSFNRHVTELYQLSKEELHSFMEDIAHTSQILNEVFHPDKINYAIYGDIVSHLHVHIVPKSRKSSEWGDAFINSPDNKHYLNEENYTKIINIIRKRLN